MVRRDPLCFPRINPVSSSHLHSSTEAIRSTQQVVSRTTKWQMPQVSLAQFHPKNFTQGLTSKLRRKKLVDEEATEDTRTHSRANSEQRAQPQTASPLASVTSSMRNDSISSSSTAMRNSVSREEEVEFEDVEEKVPSKEKQSFFARKPKAEQTDAPNTDGQKRGWLPWRKNKSQIETERDEYSDVGAHPRVRDRGLNSGFEKVGLANATNSDESASIPKNKSTTAADKAEPARTQTRWNPFAKKAIIDGSGKPAIPSTSTVTSASQSSASAEAESGERKRSWSMGVFKRSNKKKVKESTEVGSETAKKSGFFSRRSKTASGTAPMLRHV